ncbi:hypothetical protein LINGRAHAP2_LOCUS22307 [Linum grandiflorum]
MTITLHDVRYILQVPIKGKCLRVFFRNLFCHCNSFRFRIKLLTGDENKLVITTIATRTSLQKHKSGKIIKRTTNITHKLNLE